jgi:hypothetical protein
MDAWMDGWIDGQTDGHKSNNLISPLKGKYFTNRTHDQETNISTPIRGLVSQLMR